MKNNKVWYLVCFIGIIGWISTFSFNFNEVTEIVLIFVSAICLSVSYIQIMHHKMMEKDQNYKISVNDERNEKIRDKTKSAFADILMHLMGIISVICISIKAYLPAVLSGASVVFSPLIMFFIYRYYEKKY